MAYPPGTSNYHYELELVTAIGKSGFRIDSAKALSHIYRYACGLDMIRRDLQLLARQQRRPWDLGKDFEESAVLSEIVRTTVSGHPHVGRLELTVNGMVKQSSDLRLLIHSVPVLVAHLSSLDHLQPGDLIFTGTPEGVGPVVAGDLIEGSIERIGTVSLSISSAEHLIPESPITT